MQTNLRSGSYYRDKLGLEMILGWVRDSGKDALKRAEHNLEKRRVKPTDIKQHIEQLLKLMDQEYWLDPPCIYMDLDVWDIILPLRKKIFKEMLEEIPKFIEMDGKFGLRYFTLEAQLSNALDKILRLSSWTPSTTHNKRLRELLRRDLLILTDLGGNKEYHQSLCNFMEGHTTFCAFPLENAYAIIGEDSETTAELCQNLRRLAQNLGKITSTKAERYQTLYENFIAHKEDLSHWLDSASPGQGNLYICFLNIAFYIWFVLVGLSLVESFTSSLKDMASSMRREAKFWNSQSNQFHIWRNIREKYGRYINAMPHFPSEQLDLNDHRSSTTPFIPGSVTQVSRYPEFLIDVIAYELISRILCPRPNVCHKPRNGWQQLSPTYYKSCG